MAKTVQKHEGYYLHIPKWFLIVVLALIWILGSYYVIGFISTEIPKLSYELRVFMAVTSLVTWLLPFIIWIAVSIDREN